MPLPSGDRSIPVQWSRRGADGNTEGVHGSLVIPEHDPKGFRIYLGNTFPSENTMSRAISTGALDAEVYPILHGDSAEGMFTAVDSRVVGYNHRFGGAKLSDTTLQPRFLLMGSSKLHEDELAVTRAVVKFWYQDEWADWIHLQYSGPSPETPEAPPGVHILPIAPKEAVVDGATVRLEDASPRMILPNRKITIKQQSRFVLEFQEPVRLPELINDWLIPLRILLGAGMRREIGIDELWVHNKHWRDDETAQPIENALEVILPSGRETKADPQELRPLFKAATFDWSRDLPSMLGAIRRHRAVLDQWMDFISRPSTPPMSSFRSSRTSTMSCTQIPRWMTY